MICIPAMLVPFIAARRMTADPDRPSRDGFDARIGRSLSRTFREIAEDMDRVHDALAHARSQTRPDLGELAGAMGIDIHRIRMRGDLCGYARPVDIGRWRIVLNADDPEPRQRFTTAWMIAHHYYHRDLMRHGRGIGVNAGRDYAQVPDAPFHNPSIGREENLRASRMAIQIVMPAEVVGRLLDQGMDAAGIAAAVATTVRTAEIRIATLRPAKKAA